MPEGQDPPEREHGITPAEPESRGSQSSHWSVESSGLAGIIADNDLLESLQFEVVFDKSEFERAFSALRISDQETDQPGAHIVAATEKYNESDARG